MGASHGIAGAAETHPTRTAHQVADARAPVVRHGVSVPRQQARFELDDVADGAGGRWVRSKTAEDDEEQGEPLQLVVRSRIRGPCLGPDLRAAERAGLEDSGAHRSWCERLP